MSVCWLECCSSSMRLSECRSLAISGWMQQRRSIDITISNHSSIRSFSSFGNTILAAFPRKYTYSSNFRCATGEGWQDIMMACSGGKECALAGSYVYNRDKGNACGNDLSYIYFTSFVFLSSFLVSYIVVKILHTGAQQFLYIRCWTCSWPSSWTTSTIWLETRRFSVRIIWTNSFESGPTTILLLRNFSTVI